MPIVSGGGSGGGAVLSVAGKTGDVLITASDITGFDTAVQNAVQTTIATLDLLRESNSLSEFDTEKEKEDARAALGLSTIDGGTF